MACDFPVAVKANLMLTAIYTVYLTYLLIYLLTYFYTVTCQLTIGLHETKPSTSRPTATRKPRPTPKVWPRHWRSDRRQNFETSQDLRVEENHWKETYCAIALLTVTENVNRTVTSSFHERICLQNWR